MKLRAKIIVSFAVTFLVVLGIALAGIYYLMAINREQEFIQRIKDKTTTTFRLLLDVQGIDHDILQTFDRNTINNLYDEKVLLFDSLGRNIYSSVDDTKVLFPQEILKELRGGEEEVTYSEGEYEVYAHVIIDKGKTFYAIGKALDKYGKGKLRFLGYTLLVIFLAVFVLVVLTSFFIARQITAPILTLTDEVNNRSISNLSRVQVANTKDEIDSLAIGFNNMLARVEEAYSYQKNFIHHVSHELKTPIAVLISNIERTLASGNDNTWRDAFEFQKEGLMQFATVINTLLDISKYETSQNLLLQETVRVDELLFTCFEDLQHVYPNLKFDLSIDDSLNDAEELSCRGNERMLRIAFFNLLKNAGEYADSKTVFVRINKTWLKMEIEVLNDGATLDSSEQAKLFQHFFRGRNTGSKAGIGLGLVMAQKIIHLHKGSLTYRVTESGLNCFTVQI